MPNSARHTSASLATRLASWLSQAIQRRWYSRPGWLWLLFPLELLFRGLSDARRKRLQADAKYFPVPIVIVGNISVGGTGKTPLLVALVKRLQQRGFNPGVVSRGYGRKSSPGSADVIVLDKASTAHAVGDEPLEIFTLTGAPVVVAEDRVAAVELLLKQFDCDLVLADDGLQHYRLGREIEIAVVDAKQLLGNGHCLPLGPLREPLNRLTRVDHILLAGAVDAEYTIQQMLVEQGLPLHQSVCCFSPRLCTLVHLQTAQEFSLEKLTSFDRFEAIAAIGNPQKYFNALEELLGVDNFNRHSFPDHYAFSAKDLTDFADKPVVMTAKDAMKCKAFAQPNWWYVRLDTDVPDIVVDSIALAVAAKAIERPNVESL